MTYDKLENQMIKNMMDKEGTYFMTDATKVKLNRIGIDADFESGRDDGVEAPRKRKYQPMEDINGLLPEDKYNENEI